MRPRPSPKPESKKPGHERWLVSYADFVTLLLAFFVAIYSVTRLDKEKLAEAQESIQEATHSFFPQIVPRLILGSANKEARKGLIRSNSLSPGPAMIPRTEMEQLQQKLLHLLKDSPLAQDVQIFETEQGMVMRFQDLVFFDTGKASLRPAIYPLLNQIAGLLKQIPNEIVVEGHTDNRPIHTAKFPSNWELSTARATALVRYFIEHGHLPPGRLSAAGYGEYHPVADNRDEAGQQANRRVDLIIRSRRSSPRKLYHRPKPSNGVFRGAPHLRDDYRAQTHLGVRSRAR